MVISYLSLRIVIMKKMVHKITITSLLLGDDPYWYSNFRTHAKNLKTC